MTRLGLVLVILAFLGGAFLTALDPREMRWGLFVPIVLLGFAGVYLMKQGSKQKALSDAVLTENRNNIEASLTRIISNLTELDAKKQDMTPHELLEEIDRRLRADLAQFADSRETLAHLYGLQSYADIMTAFAAGERYVNRVWSASADGYLAEARAYVSRSLEQFVDAKTRIDAAHAAVLGSS